MEKFIINCILNLEEEVEVIAKNEDEAYEIAKEKFTAKFTNKYLDEGMDFEILTEVEHLEYWN